MTKDDYVNIMVQLKNERFRINDTITRLRKEFLEKYKSKKVPVQFIRNQSLDEKIDKIFDIVSTHYKVDKELIMSTSRIPYLVIPRQLIMYFSVFIAGVNKVYVGKYFERDHSTVIHACTRVQDLIDTEPPFRKTVEELKEKIKEALV